VQSTKVLGLKHLIKRKRFMSGGIMAGSVLSGGVRREFKSALEPQNAAR